MYRAKIVLINLAVFVALVVAVEIAFWAKGKITPKPAGPAMFPIRYEEDEFRRRLVRNSNPAKRSRLLIVAGCSYVYGDAISTEETLPQLLSNKAYDYFVYNYGFRGGGPYSFVKALSDPGFLNKIASDKQGGEPVVVYIFWAELIKRSIVPLSYAYRVRMREPYYELTDDDRLIDRGPYHQAKPLRTWIYRILSASHALRHFNFDWPPYLTEGDIDYTARLLREARDVVRDKLGTDRFYVVNYMSSERVNDRVAAKLKGWNMNFLDYRHYLRGHPEYWVPSDGHPAGKLNEVVAELLLRDLDLQDGKKRR